MFTNETRRLGRMYNAISTVRWFLVGDRGWSEPGSIECRATNLVWKNLGKVLDKGRRNS